MEWADTGNRQELVNSIPAIVHECNHSLTADYIKKILKEHNISPLAEDFHQTYRYYREGEETVRYKTYIYPRWDNAESFKDFCSLIEEFNCYYHQTRTDMELLDFWKNELEQTAANWLEYFANCFSSYYAYAEFKLYILTYLLVAKEHYPDIYKLIMVNSQFKRVFLEIDKKYSGLIHDFFNNKKKMIEQWLIEQGFETEEDSSFFWIKDKSGSNGKGHYLGTYKSYVKEMEKHEYQALMAEMAR